MSRKAVQIMVGVLTLLGWSLWSVQGIPTARLEGIVNYPNPFDSRRTATIIAYTLRADTRVTVRLFDLMGGLVREWEFSAGRAGAQQGMNRLTWDGTNESGDKVSAGGYICQVLAEEENGLVQGIRKIGVVH